MADFARVMDMDKRIRLGSNRGDDYPPFALASWDDRVRFGAYLERINRELDAADAVAKQKSKEAVANG